MRSIDRVRPAASEAVTDMTQDSRALAEEFDVPHALMERFVNRFSPKLVAPDSFRADADTMLFVHIPKTAGMSVGRSFQETFDIFRGVHWQDVVKSFRNQTREAIYLQSQGRARQVIMGHYGWPELQVWRNHEMPMKCGTILRDPVARTISNYHYNCSAAHPDNEGFRNRFPTLDAYVQQIPYDVQVTQALGMVCSFENVLTKLINHYTFLGVTERLSASLAHLARSHGLPKPQEFRENIGKASEDEAPSADLIKRIEARCHNDRKLHSLLMRLYEVPPEQSVRAATTV